MIVLSTEMKHNARARPGRDSSYIVLIVLHGVENYFLQVVRFREGDANR